MLQTYQAQLSGSQLIWIDQPPVHADHQRVIVVMEGAQGVQSAAQPVAQTERLAAFLSARGCLSHLQLSGQGSRDDVLAQLDQLRDDWSRDPLGPSGPRQ